MEQQQNNDQMKNSVSQVESFAAFAGQGPTPSNDTTDASATPKATTTPTDQTQAPTAQGSEGEKKPIRSLSPIQADKDGVLMPRTLEDQYRYAVAVCKSGMVPASMNTPEKVLVAMQFAAELGLKPITAMRQIYVVNGAPSLWGDLPLSLVMQSRLLVDFEEFFIDSKYQKICEENGNLDAEVFGATCRLKRVGRPEVRRTFDRKDAEKAGLWAKKVWAVYPKRMFQCRARSWALKDEFPDVLMGAPIAEYDFDVIPGTENSGVQVERPKRSASSLNEKFKDQESSSKAAEAVEADFVEETTKK